MMRGQTYNWGTVDQWLERTTDDRVVAGSNLTGAACKLLGGYFGNLLYPTLPATVSFGRDYNPLVP